MEYLDETIEPAIERAVVRAIETMHENMAEPITIDDMARTAMYSKFHFSREFQRVTGISPGRFLSAIRLQRAKDLLVSTSLTVTEISHRVGYTSVGTFSSRFATSVGVPPTSYRQLGGFTREILMDNCSRSQASLSTTVRGVVHAPVADELGLIFIGLFPSRIPQGRPVRCTVLHRAGPFVLEEVPPGTWYLLGHSVPAFRNELLTSDQELSVGSYGPVEVHTGVPIQWIDFRLRAIRALDPPVLLALLDVREVAFREGLASVRVS